MKNLPTKFDADYIDLRLIFRSLIEKKWLIISISFMLFFLAIFYTLLKPDQYQTSILLQIEQKQHGSLGAFAKSNILVDQENVPLEPLSVQIALIRSKFILGPVIESLGLDIITKQPTVFPYFYKKNDRDIKISQLTLPTIYLNKPLHLIITGQNHYELYDDHQNLLIKGIVGERIQSNEMIIKIDALNDSESKDFIIIKKSESEILKNLISHLSIIDLSNSNDNNSNRIGILQISYTGSNPQQITQILNKISDVMQKKNIEYKKQQAENKLTFLMRELPIVKNSLQKAETTLNLYRSTTNKVDVQLKTHELMEKLTAIDKQLQELRLKKSNLLQQYTFQYPFLRLTNEKINELEKTRLQTYYQLKKIPAADEEAQLLKRDIDVKNQLYLNLLNQIHELEVAKAGIIGDNHILVLATVPDMPIPTKLSVIGFVSLFVGFILACLLAIFVKLFERRLKDPHWSLVDNSSSETTTSIMESIP